MLKAGTDISTFSSEEVINLDAKESNSDVKSDNFSSKYSRYR